MMRLRTEWQAEQQPLDQEFARRERKPYLTARAGDLSLRAWRGSWERVDYDEEGSISFSVRSIDFLIEDRTHPIAGGRLKVWRCTDGCGFVDVFRLCADEYSKADYDASEVVYAAWPHGLVADSPFTHGDLVIFDRLRIEVTSAVLSRAAWSLIAKVIDPFRNKKSRTRGSVLLLKAFPLEFEGIKSGQPFEHRRDAMVRLYQRRLGVSPLPTKDGREGWLWARLAHSPDPVASTHRGNSRGHSVPITAPVNRPGKPQF